MYILPGVIHSQQLLLALHNAAIAGLNSLVLCLCCCIVSVPLPCRQLGVGPVAVTSLLIGNGIKNMLPGSENIDNPSNPAPQFVDLQNIYNRKVGKA
jgi:hypothetical protein